MCVVVVRRRQWHPTPIPLPGKSHGRRNLVGCSPWGREESDTTERLHFHFSLSCIGEGNGNPLQCSCLENPRDGGAWWAAIYGVAQSRTRLKWLSSSSCCCWVAKSCLTLLQPHGLQPTRLLHPWDFPGKNTGVGCHFLLQVIFKAQESNPGLLYWQEDSLPLSHQGSPIYLSIYIYIYFFFLILHCRQILYCLSHQGSPVYLC